MRVTQGLVRQIHLQTFHTPISVTGDQYCSVFRRTDGADPVCARIYLCQQVRVLVNDYNKRIGSVHAAAAHIHVQPSLIIHHCILHISALRAL